MYVNAMPYTLQVVELAFMPFSPNQLRTLMVTRVLAGVHGAGLANQLWMAPGRGAVLELWQGMSGEPADCCVMSALQ